MPVSPPSALTSSRVANRTNMKAILLTSVLCSAACAVCAGCSAGPVEGTQVVKQKVVTPESIVDKSGEAHGHAVKRAFIMQPPP
jgi:hypothetical protein